MVNDEFDEISINEGVAPHGGNVQLLAVALEDGYTWDDYLAGRLPAAGQRFTWTTSNANQASIELADGETGLCLFHCVRVTGNGYVTLRATTKDGSGAYGIFRLRIVPPITEIQNIPEELVLRVGEEHTFDPVIVPEDVELPDLFWHEIKERDRHIASMDGNTVTALSPGTVTLTVAPVGQQNTVNGIVNAPVRTDRRLRRPRHHAHKRRAGWADLPHRRCGGSLRHDAGRGRQQRGRGPEGLLGLLLRERLDPQREDRRNGVPPRWGGAGHRR